MRPFLFVLHSSLEKVAVAARENIAAVPFYKNDISEMARSNLDTESKFNDPSERSGVSHTTEFEHWSSLVLIRSKIIRILKKRNKGINVFYLSICLEFI